MFYFTVLLKSYVCFILDLGLCWELPTLYLILSNMHIQRGIQNGRHETWPRWWPFRSGWWKDTAVSISTAHQALPALRLLSTWRTSVLHRVGPSNSSHHWIVNRSVLCGFQPEHLVMPYSIPQSTHPLPRWQAYSRWWLHYQPGVQREGDDSTEQHPIPNNEQWIHSMSKK